MTTPEKKREHVLKTRKDDAERRGEKFASVKNHLFKDRKKLDNLDWEEANAMMPFMRRDELKNVSKDFVLKLTSEGLEAAPKGFIKDIVGRMAGHMHEVFTDGKFLQGFSTVSSMKRKEIRGLDLKAINEEKSSGVSAWDKL